MYSIDEIISFIEKETGASKEEIKPGTDIFDDLGVCGDDFHELMADYSDRFKVDLSEYLWYFHCDEEGQNIGGVFFAPPYKRVKRIPITPELLLRFANEGKWTADYPDHKMPKYRYDILIGVILLLSFMFYSLYRLIK